MVSVLARPLARPARPAALARSHAPNAFIATIVCTAVYKTSMSKRQDGQRNQWQEAKINRPRNERIKREYILMGSKSSKKPRLQRRGGQAMVITSYAMRSSVQCG